MREIELPSGKKAKIRQGKGKDLIKAQRAAKSPDEIGMALIAELTTIDDKPVMFEDLLEMDLADVLRLQQEVGGNL